MPEILLAFRLDTRLCDITLLPPTAYILLVLRTIDIDFESILLPFVSNIGSPSLAAIADALMASASPSLPLATNTLPTEFFMLSISLATL